MALVKGRSSEECGNDEEWTMIMGRGGLWYIKETTYMHCFYPLRKKSNVLKPYIKVTSSGFIATADFEFDDRETHEKFLHMIVELSLTIRGYSYASAWMEK